MITLFTIPRDFAGIFKIIQLNAIKSWRELGVEVIVFGNAKGAAEICKQLELHYVPDVKINHYGTPLISDAFRRIDKLTTADTLGYINCDIILLPDFLAAHKKVFLNKFLLVGQRRSLIVNKQVVGQMSWQVEIAHQLEKQRSRPRLGSSDYFVYPRSVVFPQMPPFAVGKLYWDKWLYYTAKKMSLPIVDATNSITAIHQQHYLKKDEHGYGEEYLGRQAAVNKSCMPLLAEVFTIFDADLRLENGELVKPEINFLMALRKLQMKMIVEGNQHLLMRPVLWILQILRRIIIR